MNKKFSTLVAALLVTGGSFAMVSQYVGSPLTESPLAMAAAANLRATAVASEATAILGAVDVSEVGDANWTIVAVKGGFSLKTGNFYLCEDHELCKNVADAALITLGDDNELLINGEDASDNVDLYLWTDETTRVALLRAGTKVYVAPEADLPDPVFDAAEHKAVTVNEALQPANLSIVTSGSLENLSAFTVVGLSGNNFKLKVGEKFLARDGEEAYKLVDTEAEAATVGLWNSSIVLDNNYYLNASEDGVSVVLNSLGGGSDKAGLYDSTTGTQATSSAWTLSSLSDGQTVVIAKSYSAGVATNGVLFTDTKQATLKFAQSDTPLEWTAAPKNGGFILSDGNGYLALDDDAVKLDADESNALIFNLDEDGCVMVAGKYLTTGLRLADDDAEALIAYDGNGASTTSSTEVKTLGQQIVQAVTMDNEVVAKVATKAANLVNGETYMIWGTGKYALGVVAGDNGYKLAVSTKFNGQATQLRTTNSITSINQVLWKVAKDNSTGTPLYSFTNVESGVKLAYSWDEDDSKYVFNPAGTISKFSLEDENLTFTVNGTKYYVNITSTAVGTVSTSPVALTFATPDEAPVGPTGRFNAADAVKLLNETYGMGSGFGLMFKDRELGTKGCKDMVLEANPFTDNAIITAVQGPGNLNGKMFLKVAGSYEYKATTDADELKALRNAFRASTFIAVDTVRYSNYVNDETGNNFFKYTTVKGSEMMLANGTVYEDASNKAEFERGGDYYGITRRIENAEFEVSQVAGAKVSDPVKLYVPTAYVPAKDNGAYYLIGHNAAEGVTQRDLQINIKEFLKKNYVGAYKDSWDYIYVGLNNDVDYKSINGIVNLISRNYKTDGQVYATHEYGSGVDRVLAKYVALDKPEGQFLVTGGDYADNGTINPFVFTNRESGAKIRFNGFKKTDKANIYAAGTDTIEIKAASTANQFDGYANYKKSVLDNTEYVLKVVSNAAGIQDIYVAEDHNKDHSLGLNADTLEAANFKLIKFEAKADMDAYKDYGDTVFVSQKPYSYVAVDKYGEEYYAQAKDRVVAFTYAIYNAANNEFLAINNDKGSTLQNFFYCNPELKYNGANADAAQRFIIKEKSNGAVQLIPVSVHNSDFVGNPNTNTPASMVKFYDLQYTQTANGYSVSRYGIANSKVYAGLSDNKLHVESPIYKIADNDLFTIQQIGAPLYRALENEVYDKVRIYKEGTKNVALFAESADKALVSGENWLGMEHKADADLTKTMFSFVLDTAYVDRAENYKPQYLLAIDSEVIPSANYCKEHGINPDPDCGHTTQTIAYMKGSYLVNLADSANAWDKNAHVNPYQYDGYNRLGFVKATHVKDQLIIERGAPTAADTLNLTKDVQAKFALKIVDQDSKSFVLETKGGYLKWLNGVPVVVNAEAQAEVLNIESTENAATANEAIAAEGVQVIAGKGVVTVQGAAGKVITVANILGQTIANQVAASDNVTIAAPAGVVVVAVDGEATKVVVK